MWVGMQVITEYYVMHAILEFMRIIVLKNSLGYFVNVYYCPSGDNIEILPQPRVVICTHLGIVYCTA